MPAGSSVVSRSDIGTIKGIVTINLTDGRWALIAVKRATILLRFDWLTGLIGALLR